MKNSKTADFFVIQRFVFLSLVGDMIIRLIESFLFLLFIPIYLNIFSMIVLIFISHRLIIRSSFCLIEVCFWWQEERN